MPLVLSGTDGLSGVDGTASNPAIEGTDSNTGIFYPAADTVAIGTGGTEALRVTSAQNVRKIYGTEIQSLTSGGSTSHMLSYQTWNGTANLLVLGNTFDGVVFATGGGIMTEKMRLDMSGNLGVGTSSPGNRLHVLQTINANAVNTQARFQDNGTTGGTSYQQRISISGKSGAGNIDIGTTDSSTVHFGGQACTFFSADTLPLNILNLSNQPLLLGTNAAERVRIEGDGDQTFFRASKFYGEKRIQYTASAFNNPTLSLVSFLVTPVAGQFPQIIVKVTVFQTGWSSNVGNIHNGYATTSYSETTGWNAAVANTMVVEANLGTANVGTLSWSTSGNTRTLSYTTNRATNFDSYVIKVEIATTVNGFNFDVTFLN